MYYYQNDHILDDSYNSAGHDHHGQVQAEYVYEEIKTGNLPPSKPGVRDGGYMLPTHGGNGAPEIQQPTIRPHNKRKPAVSDIYDENHYSLARNSGFDFDSTDGKKHGKTNDKMKKGCGQHRDCPAVSRICDLEQIVFKF